MPAEITLETAFFSKPYILIINMYPILTKSLQYYKNLSSKPFENVTKELLAQPNPSSWVMTTDDSERTSLIQTSPHPHRLVLLQSMAWATSYAKDKPALVLRKWYCRGTSSRAPRLQVPASTRVMATHSGDKFLLPVNGIF